RSESSLVNCLTQSLNVMFILLFISCKCLCAFIDGLTRVETLISTVNAFSTTKHTTFIQKPVIRLMFLYAVSTICTDHWLTSFSRMVFTSLAGKKIGKTLFILKSVFPLGKVLPFSTSE